MVVKSEAAARLGARVIVADGVPNVRVSEISDEGSLEAVDDRLQQAVKGAKAFGLPPLARWRLDDALKATGLAKKTLSHTQRLLHERTEEYNLARAEAEAVIRERDVAISRATRVEKRARAYRQEKAAAEKVLQEEKVAIEKALELEKAAAERARDESRAELSQGRREAQQLYGDLNDALEREQDAASRTRIELEAARDEVERELRRVGRELIKREEIVAQAEAAKAEALAAADALYVEKEEATAKASEALRMVEADAAKAAEALQVVKVDAERAKEAAAAKAAEALRIVKVEVETLRAEQQAATTKAVEALRVVRVDAAAANDEAARALRVAASRAEQVIRQRDEALARAAQFEAKYQAELARRPQERLRRLMTRVRYMLRFRRRRCNVGAGDETSEAEEALQGVTASPGEYY